MRVALVTGASKNIGLAISEELVRAGCAAALLGRDEHAVGRAASDLAADSSPTLGDASIARRFYEGGAQRTPAKRAGLPSEVAALCGFLCSDHAGFHHRTDVLDQRRVPHVTACPC